MDFLETLKQDPECLYIYTWGPYIYGLSKTPTHYIVIVSDYWKSPEELGFPEIWGINGITINGIFYQFYRMKYWFDKVLFGDIDCWECACLNKKFIIKEHVKLMMTTNPLQLRKEIDLDLNIDFPDLINESELILLYWRVIRRCKFANQIIENHKIVNFKEANKDFYLLEEAYDKEFTYKTLLEVPYKNLRLKTDDILRRSKIQKILQKQNG